MYKYAVFGNFDWSGFPLVLRRHCTSAAARLWMSSGRRISLIEYSRSVKILVVNLGRAKNPQRWLLHYVCYLRIFVPARNTKCVSWCHDVTCLSHSIPLWRICSMTTTWKQTRYHCTKKVVGHLCYIFALEPHDSDKFWVRWYAGSILQNSLAMMQKAKQKKIKEKNEVKDDNRVMDDNVGQLHRRGTGYWLRCASLYLISLMRFTCQTCRVEMVEC